MPEHNEDGHRLDDAITTFMVCGGKATNARKFHYCYIIIFVIQCMFLL